MITKIKDPDAKLDYGFDLTKWLAPDGDTITSSVWIVDTGITVDSDSHTDTLTTVWLEGGTAGQFYNATNRITTAQGRIDDNTFTVCVRNK